MSPPPAVALPHCDDLLKVYCSREFGAFDGGNKCNELKKSVVALNKDPHEETARTLDKECVRAYPSALAALRGNKR